MFLLFQSSFRLSEKNEKDKKRKVLTPVSATPTHMLRICVISPCLGDADRVRFANRSIPPIHLRDIAHYHRFGESHFCIYLYIEI